MSVLFRDLFRSARDAVRGRSRLPAGPVAEDFRCALCGGERAREMFVAGIPDSRDYSVVRCGHCALVATHPAPALADIPSFYGEHYYGEENARFGPVTEFFVLLFRWARLRALRRMGVSRAAVLDVGCSRGHFLQALRRLGYQPYGTELDATSGTTAQSRFGPDRVRLGPLQQSGFAEGQFEAITMWQVFEHLPDPLGDLDECHRLLKPGGALLLGVPNFDSFQARFSGPEWFHLDVPRHLFHFTPETLTRMLREHGFEVEEISHYNLEQNPFGLLQSALHRLGRGHLALYDLLKGPRATPGMSVLGRLWRLGGYLLTFPVVALASYYWSFRQSGATFTVMARRVERKPSADPVHGPSDVPAAAAGPDVESVPAPPFPSPAPATDKMSESALPR